MSLSSPAGRTSRGSRRPGHRRRGSGGSHSSHLSYASFASHGTHQTHGTHHTHQTHGTHHTHQTQGTHQSHGAASASNVPHYMQSTVASIHQASPRSQTARGLSTALCFASTRDAAGRSSDEHRVDDRPVQDFVDALSSLPSDEWRSRTSALEKLVETVPKSPEADRLHPSHRPGTMPWYRSPATLRRLAPPMRELMEDPRSTVVRHACENLASLVERVANITSTTTGGDDGGTGGDDGGTAGGGSAQQQKQSQSDVARYLMKDLLPAVLGMHAQTVKVVRGYALQMMLSVIPCCRFKSGLPVLLERLRRDKSRDVREASARYLRAVLESWSSSQSSSTVGGAYITRDIAVHIGNALARALMDSSQCVRMEARRGFEDFRRVYPEVWDHVVHREDGPLSKDLRLKKSVINAAVRADAERSLAGERLLSTAENDNDEDAGSVGSYHSAHSYTSGHSRISASSGRGSGVPSWGQGGAGTRSRQGHGGNSIGGGRRAPPPAGMRSPAGKCLDRSERDAFPPKSPAPIDRESVGNRAAAQPFAGVIKSPDPSDRRDSTLLIARNMLDKGGVRGLSAMDNNASRPHRRTNDLLDGATSAMRNLNLCDGAKLEDNVMDRAAASIQAAARGMTTRKRILERVSEGRDVSSAFLASDGKTPNQSSPAYMSQRPADLSTKSGDGEVSLELEMLRDAKRALKLGMTAKQMAYRRQTVDNSAAVPPIPPSPAVADARAFAASCASPAIEQGASDRHLHHHHSPRDQSPGHFGWRGSPSPGMPKSGGRTLDLDRARRSHLLPQTPDSVGTGATGTTTGTDTVDTPASLAAMDLRTATAEKLLTLRKASKLRDRKSSVMLQERLRRASPRIALKENGGEGNGPKGSPGERKAGGEGPSSSSSPELGTIHEHVVIAEEILAAHRKSMDEMMANLSLEMDVLRDFEAMLLQHAQVDNGGGNGNDVRRPTDDDVLEYFENVALCLDERFAIGERLRGEMDRIGSGEDEKEGGNNATTREPVEEV